MYSNSMIVSEEVGKNRKNEKKEKKRKRGKKKEYSGDGTCLYFEQSPNCMLHLIKTIKQRERGFFFSLYFKYLKYNGNNR